MYNTPQKLSADKSSAKQKISICTNDSNILMEVEGVTIPYVTGCKIIAKPEDSLSVKISVVMEVPRSKLKVTL